MSKATTFDALLERVKKYPKGFQFSFPYGEMPEKVRQNATRFAQTAINKGLIKSVSIGAGWNSDGSFDGFQKEIFERI